MEDFLTGKKHIHFIGIGGSGMYPLAQILHSQGYYLTGSDNNETATLDAVRKMGIPVHLGHSPANIEGADLIVHTAAIMADNPELIAAKQSGVLTVAQRAARISHELVQQGVLRERHPRQDHHDLHADAYPACGGHRPFRSNRR